MSIISESDFLNISPKSEKSPLEITELGFVHGSSVLS